MNLLKFFKKRKKKEKLKYSFCETATASPYSHWHIRKLTENGSKLGGGIDTEGLCGFPNLKFGGWDIQVPITDHHLEKSACKKCAELYRKLIKGKN